MNPDRRLQKPVAPDHPNPSPSSFSVFGAADTTSPFGPFPTSVSTDLKPLFSGTTSQGSTGPFSFESQLDPMADIFDHLFFKLDLHPPSSSTFQGTIQKTCSPILQTAYARQLHPLWSTIQHVSVVNSIHSNLSK